MSPALGGPGYTGPGCRPSHWAGAETGLRKQQRVGHISEVTQDPPVLLPPATPLGQASPEPLPRCQPHSCLVTQPPSTPSRRYTRHFGPGAGEQFPAVSLHDWPSMTSALSEVPMGAPNHTQILEGCLGDRGFASGLAQAKRPWGECWVTEPGWSCAGGGNSLNGPGSPLHPSSLFSSLGKSYAPTTITRRAIPGDPKSPASTCDSKRKVYPHPNSFRTRNV